MVRARYCAHDAHDRRDMSGDTDAARNRNGCDDIYAARFTLAARV